MNKKAIFSTKWIAYTALLTAFVVATGYIPGIPVLDGKIYWCDFAIFTAAYLMDPISATIVGGVGTTFFDLFGINGTAYNAIPSLLIHGLQGCIASVTFTLLRKFFNKSNNEKREAVFAILSSIVPALWVIFGYFIKRITWEGKLPEAALLKMPANVLQEIIGIAVAFVICYVCRLKQQLKRNHLLPDFRLEVLNKSESKPVTTTANAPEEATVQTTAATTESAEGSAQKSSATRENAEGADKTEETDEAEHKAAD